jgi:dihydroorotate dehydrogenase (NAD+) catalytic subunit
MTTHVAGVEFPNPVFTASGCAAAGRELDQFFDITSIGGVVTKSIMVAARSGRATPRMAETPSGMLNSIGLQGPGIDAFLEHDLAWLETRGARAVVSIAGGSVEDYALLAERLSDSPAVAMIEVNISCPNVEDRGQVFACDPAAAAAVVEAVRARTPVGTPVLAKLSPDVTDITVIARACVDAGADGLSVINTLLGMVIDTDTLRPALAGVTGGLSGPAIRPVAVRCVYQVHAALPHVPILGMGGIRTGLDALQFVLAGASAVSVGTTVFGDPSAPLRVLAELEQALAERGFERFSDAVGLAHPPPVERLPEGPDPVGDTDPGDHGGQGGARSAADTNPRPAAGSPAQGSAPYAPSAVGPAARSARQAIAEPASATGAPSAGPSPSSDQGGPLRTAEEQP